MAVKGIDKIRAVDKELRTFTSLFINYLFCFSGWSTAATQIKSKPFETAFKIWLGDLRFKSRVQQEKKKKKEW